MQRSMDARHLNAVANDPAVRPWLGGAGDIDLAQLLVDPANIALQNEHGGFLFCHLGDGRYELHTLFGRSGRGRAVLEASAFATRYMFTATDCVEIVTKCPEPNRAADFMARRAGYRPLFERLGAWEDGSAIRYFWLTFEDWRGQDPTLAEEGHAFHEIIERAKRDAGSALPIHPDDEAHDRAAGAACLMFKAGQTRKAVTTYNRWASLAGYAPVSLLSEAPPMIDIQDAVLGLRAGKLEVLLCR